MESLREYALNIVAVSIVAIVFENIMPEQKYKKYVSSIIGIIVMMSILKPISTFSDFRGKMLSLPQFKYSYDYLENENFVLKQFESDLSKKIEIDVSEKFNKNIAVSITAKADESGNVTAIESVGIVGGDDEVSKYISENYGISDNLIQIEKERTNE